MEDFLPGLVKVMEERLGPFGRPFTTLVVVMVGLWVIIWTGDFILNEAIIPVIKAVTTGDPENLATARRIAAMIVGALVGLGLTWVIGIPIRRRNEKYRRDLSQYRKDLQRVEELLDKHGLLEQD